MVAFAYLRVFQPLDSLPEADRLRWERYVVQGGHRRPAPPRVYRQRANGRGALFGLLTAEEDRADVRVVDGRWYVCPWRTPLRILAGLLSLRDEVPEEMAEALVPESETRRAARELARIRRRDPRAVPALIQSAWHVPIRWFVLFGDQDRRLEERDEGGYRLSYWTSLPAARGRARRAVRVLEGGDLSPVGAVVQDLDDWLSCFDPRCAVELDYAGVSDWFGWGDLHEDHSAGEIEGALEALEAGDHARAEELYRDVAARWAEVRLRESLN